MSSFKPLEVQDRGVCMIEQITEIICRVGEIPSLGPGEDFRGAGVASVNELLVLMELEQSFEVSIPDEVFMRAQTANDLENAIRDLKANTV